MGWISCYRECQWVVIRISTCQCNQLGVFPVTVTLCALAVGAWFSTVIETVAGALSVGPSLTVNVKLSGPA